MRWREIDAVIRRRKTRRYFPPGRNPAERIPLKQRFWFYVSKTENCWNWMGHTDPDGYGTIKMLRHGKYVTKLAHKVSFALHRQKIPRGMQIDHLCHNRRCVRPDHLELVSGRENNSRSNSPSALNAKKTHCIRGHELSGPNCYITRMGHRSCKLCDRAARKKQERRDVHAAYMRKWLRKKKGR